MRTIEEPPQHWLPPRRFSFDVATRTVTVIHADGSEFSGPVAQGLQTGWDILRRSDADLVAGELSLTLASGARVSVDLGWPGERDRPPKGVPIVYLDQRHWITLAQYLRAPDRVASRDRAAAADLIERARDRRALLPLSSAHMTETAPVGKHRRDLTLTLLELSHGLQMRNPMAVRHRELVAAMSGREPEADAVFSLEPDVTFVEPAPTPTPADFPPAWRELHRRMTSRTAIIATMLEHDDPETDDPGPAAAQRWADAYQAHARRVQADSLSRDETRGIAHRTLLADLNDQIVNAACEAGLVPDRLPRWLGDHAQRVFQQAPHLRTLQDVLYHRLRNAEDRWERNDLLDMHFLSCAAGYADVVVGEKKFTDYLRRARSRYPQNAIAVATLADAVEKLG